MTSPQFLMSASVDASKWDVDFITFLLNDATFGFKKSVRESKLF